MTPTSATGRRDRPAARAGFTLVELMLVLAILGLASAAVVMTTPTRDPGVSDDAARLAARLVRARDEALLSNRPIAAITDTSGVRFETYDGTAWAHLTDGSLKAIRWSPGVQLVEGGGRVQFDPTGLADPGRLMLSRGAIRRTIVVDSAGEVRLVD